MSHQQTVESLTKDCLVSCMPRHGTYCANNNCINSFTNIAFWHPYGPVPISIMYLALIAVRNPLRETQIGRRPKVDERTTTDGHGWQPGTPAREPASHTRTHTTKMRMKVAIKSSWDLFYPIVPYVKSTSPHQFNPAFFKKNWIFWDLKYFSYIKYFRNFENWPILFFWNFKNFLPCRNTFILLLRRESGR